jgi:hypothetical protein
MKPVSLSKPEEGSGMKKNMPYLGDMACFSSATSRE